MVDSDKKNPKPDDVWETLHTAFNGEAPLKVQKKLKERLEWFREDLQVHPYITQGRRHEITLRQKIAILITKAWRPLALTCAGLVAVVLTLFFFSGHSTLTWANVMKRFSHSPFLAASVYIRYQPFARPEMVEYWKSREDKIRILSGHLVTFASQESIRTFNLATREACAGDSATQFILNLYGYENSMIPSAEFAKSLYEDLYDGKALESTYLINPSPEITENLLVFDLKHKTSGLMLRTWVLSTSMLPIRLHYWNDNGSRTEVLFSYTKEQPKGFFDPEQFEAKLKTDISSAELMYLGIEKVGERGIAFPGT